MYIHIFTIYYYYYYYYYGPPRHSGEQHPVPGREIPFGDHPLYIYIYIYVYTLIYIYIYIYIYTYIVNIGTIQRRLAWPLRKDDAHESRGVSNFDIRCPAETRAAATFGRGVDTVGNPRRAQISSIRACQAYPLVEIRQTVARRAIRGNSTSVNSTIPPSYTSRDRIVALEGTRGVPRNGGLK